MLQYIQLLFILLFVPVACGNSKLGMEGTSSPSHEIWDKLLQTHVSVDGKVNYQGFIQDKNKLQVYLDNLSQHAPDRKTWTQNEQLAYWINAYNAFTVKLIIDHYPLKSIQDLQPKLNIPLVNTVWNLEFFEIGGKKASLDEIEHKILRKEFDEPRIHFAINCASFSCPKLLNEAFMPAKLEKQLQATAVDFINDPKRNKISANAVEISQIFSWFKGDFTKNGSIIDYLNQYSAIKINPKAKVSHLSYDWSLNE
ncbi:DUF547 domain-containing protein [Mongoliitalea daihaiensis]|uniref:DUF547 domain-containing protein n=1 Tax=Mongoliitalea daihaiensis TaxID=2782006 RepID=UPI001F20A79B|nr:DUF547 domain-containing protein [Mongoliitalea daihaiensis]UJP64776.1 DUF547 domain-containing protein [Mongoliitalea daihaiensis]